MLYTDISAYKLSQIAETNVNTVKELANKKPKGLTIVAWYELLASILYVYNHRDVWTLGNTNKEVYDALVIHKPQYTGEQCEMAYNVLKDGCFI